ncbi:MAG TPA: hypothetical protein VN081_04430 [Dongiaceae bacterium]|nr:hypothetical protein [Dongiaceae bacterium]
MTKFKLQLPETDGVLPYPYYVDEAGLVGRQDFWQGNPYRLIGFNDKPVSGEMNVAQFIQNQTSDTPIPAEDMMLGIGNYGVFSTKDNNWFTMTEPFESVTEVK